ncbi:TetR/AcrR family transcriptional regulator [Sorangium sp. So ce1036]|uniref:TetR/AcrR family transcriptional regulator n=1 Tax=Sorangium sp. So ce1036 TaxID=3133328 RepID=UPI003F0D32CE
MNAFGEKRPPRPARKRDAQKEETRARILEVARAHFERDGFDGASVRAIAAGAGVAAGTVLLHFEDKRDLLHAALFDDLEAMIERALAARGRGRLEARLRALARPFFAYYAARPALSKALLREALLADSPWRERFTAQVARVHARIVGLAEAARARGEIAADTDAALLGAAFFSFYYFALIGWVQGALADPEPLFERLLSEHMRGVARGAARRRRRPDDDDVP